MHTTTRVAIAAAVGCLVGACAPSGYSVQARNNYPEPVEVRIVAQKGDESRTLENPQVAPGASVTFHTKAERDEKVRLEARPARELESAPSVYKMIVGLSRVVINPNPEAGKDARQPKVVVKEDR